MLLRETEEKKEGNKPWNDELEETSRRSPKGLKTRQRIYNSGKENKHALQKNKKKPPSGP